MFSTTTGADGTLHLHGRLDASQVEKAREALIPITTSCTVDFKDLEYISSAGLGVLLRYQQQLKQHGQGLKLVNMNKYIREIFSFTGFDKVFEVE
jgi:anti-sigma B factor antagonist